jgi:hypothetical protein
MAQQEEESEGPQDVREFFKDAGLPIKEGADFLVSLGKALQADPAKFSEQLVMLPRWKSDFLEYLGMNSQSESGLEEISVTLTKKEYAVWEALLKEKRDHDAEEDFIIDGVLD